MTTALPPFIQQVQQQRTKWVPVSTPALDDAAWEAAWALSDDLAKANLAAAWAWCFREDMQRSADAAVIAKRVWNQQRHWIRQIYPLVKDQFFGPLDRLRLAHPLGAPQEQTRDLAALWSLLQPVWFGDTDVERLNGLETLYARKVANRELNAMGQVIAALAWDVVALPGATEQHRFIAATYSTYFDGHTLAPASLDAGDQFWRSFSRACRTRNAGSTKRVDAAQFRDRLAQEPLSVALPLFLKLWERCVAEGRGKSSEKGVVLPNADVLTYGCAGTPHIYEVLRSWFPAHSKTWDVAEELGMKVYETARVVLNKETVNPAATLPDNLTDSLGVN